jgi:hypothetical protein
VHAPGGRTVTRKATSPLSAVLLAELSQDGRTDAVLTDHSGVCWSPGSAARADSRQL